jgi:hypothetical protein
MEAGFDSTRWLEIRDEEKGLQVGGASRIQYNDERPFFQGNI